MIYFKEQQDDFFRVVIQAFGNPKMEVFKHYNLNNCKLYVREFLKSYQKRRFYHNEKTMIIQIVFKKYILQEGYYE